MIELTPVETENSFGGAISYCKTQLLKQSFTKTHTHTHTSVYFTIWFRLFYLIHTLAFFYHTHPQGYGKTISHIVIGLKTAKGVKQLKLDPTIHDGLQKEKVQVGDVIYIEANSGAVKRQGNIGLGCY